MTARNRGRHAAWAALAACLLAALACSPAASLAGTPTRAA